VVDGTAQPDAGATYAAAGVSIEAGERAVERIRSVVASTARPEVLRGIGDFAGLFALDTGRFEQPVLVASTDGIGTKALVAQATGRYDTVGIDLVAMCVDDLVCSGAEPLFFLDYIATGAVDPSHMAELVAGVADGCRQVGAALLGGEMAEHPGVMQPGEFDLAGFAVGVVERRNVLGSSRVRAGDVLIGLASPGLRSNGYSLARHVLLERAGLSLDDPAWPGAVTTVADELLVPSLLYAPAVLAALSVAEVHAVSHITGGGIPANLPRALPEGARAVVERGSWPVPRIFDRIRRLGSVGDGEMARVFNLGLGMVLVVAPGSVAPALAALEGAGRAAGVVGLVEPGPRGVDLTGPDLWDTANEESN
jgi:phosphoribosylformylglycinamidine cyclo-ligase